MDDKHQARTVCVAVSASGDVAQANYLIDADARACACLPALQGEHLFVYLFRRFGYPNAGWDEQKELASYLLTTPMEGVLLGVCLAAAETSRAPKARFTTWLSTRHIKALRESAVWRRQELPLFRRIEEAIEQTLGELLRPVPLGKTFLNGSGLLTSAELERLPAFCPPYHAAGYPVLPEVYRSSDRYTSFLEALSILGEGEIESGMLRVIALAQERR